MDPRKRARTTATVDQSGRPALLTQQDRQGGTSFPKDIVTQINNLPLQTLHSIVLSLLERNPDNLTHFKNLQSRYLSEESEKKRKAPPKDFDYLSKSCWKSLNITYKRLRPSQQFEILGDISGDIYNAVKVIKKGCEENPSFETRKNALETLRKISKSIVMCDHGEIQRGIMGGMGMGVTDDLADAMLELAEGFNDDEVDVLEEEGMLDKIEELAGMMREYGLNQFDGVGDALRGDEEDDEDEDEGEDGEE